jgi:Ring finger domain
LFIILVGVAIGLVLKLTSYLAAVVVNCRVRSRDTPGPTDAIDSGSALTRNANLWGIGVDERERILQHLLQKTTFAFCSAKAVQKSQEDADLEMGVEVAVKPGDVVEDSTRSPELSDNVDATAGTVGGTANTTTCVNTVILDDSNNADHHTMCCICLVPYEEGVAVMTGTLCNHMFHRSCCQNWLLQHDDCPYCRKEMMLATELREAAIAVLGEQRVTELSMPIEKPKHAPRNSISFRLPQLGTTVSTSTIPSFDDTEASDDSSSGNVAQQGATIGGIVTFIEIDGAFVDENNVTDESDATATRPTEAPLVTAESDGVSTPIVDNV